MNSHQIDPGKITDWLRLVEEAALDFEYRRPQIREQGTFRDYLPPLVARWCTGRPGLQFPVLAKLAQTDLRVALLKGETALAADYFAAFPELAASPAVINDLLRTEARARCGDDSLRLWQFQQQLPEVHREIFTTDGLLPRYQLEEEINRGGMGVIWQGTEGELKREVAVKVPRKLDPASLESFYREAQLTSRFQHPAIVPVYGVGRTIDGRPCYAMQRLQLSPFTHSIHEYYCATSASGPQADPLAPTVVSGTTASVPNSHSEPGKLAISNTPEKRRDFKRMIGQLIDAARAVAYAHQVEHRGQRGVLHLDLKPENILVGSFGETMVLDWGLARTPDEALSGVGGTPGYMSPEVARFWLGNQADPPSVLSDVYGLGATLYHILTNRPPFTFGQDEFSQTLAADVDEKRRWLARVASEQPAPVLEVNPLADRILAAICNTAMAKSPHDRYATAKDFAADLENWQNDVETTAYPFSPLEKLDRWVRKYFRSILLTILVAILLRFGLWYGSESLKHQATAVLVENLATVAPDALITHLDQIHARPGSAHTLLKKRLDDQQNPLPNDVQWRYRLALLRYDAQQAGVLATELLKLQSADEFGILCRKLLAETSGRPKAELPELVAGVAQRFTDTGSDDREKLRVVVMLAAFNPNHGWEQAEATAIANNLVHANPAWLAVFNRWVTKTDKAQAAIKEALESLAADRSRPVQDADQAAAILAEWNLKQPEKLANQLQSATPTQLSRIIAVIRAAPSSEVAKQLAVRAKDEFERLQKPAQGKTLEQHVELDDQAAGVANLWLARWSIDPDSFDGKALLHAPDPRLRTELIHRMPQAGISSNAVAKWFAAEKRVAVRSALLMALAQYPQSDLSKTLRDKLLLHLRARAADPEFVAAADHLWRRWPQELPKWEPVESEPNQIGWIESTGHKTAANHRLVTIPLQIANTPTALGAAPDEGFFDTDERPRRVTIPRSFAISTREVTRAQFREFLEDMEGKEFELIDRAKSEFDKVRIPRFDAEDDHPVFYVNLGLAGLYCNWLSEKERLECFYPGCDSSEEDDETRKHRVDSLACVGYRLPTEEEWELACRAGTSSPRHFGFRESYLGAYATYRFNTRLGPQHVAHRLPNGWGMLDTLGNVAELCHTTAGASQRDNEVLDIGVLTGLYVRGAGSQNVPDVIRSAYRYPTNFTEAHEDIGFRIARTLKSSRIEELKPVDKSVLLEPGR